MRRRTNLEHILLCAGLWVHNGNSLIFMQCEAPVLPSYVVKAKDLPALNCLPSDHPRPQLVEWINRGTNQKLRPSSVEMLLRTLYRDVAPPSVVKLQRSAGLRMVFRSDRDRDQFANVFQAAKTRSQASESNLVTAIFADRASADRAVERLEDAGIPKNSIALLWRLSQFVNADGEWEDGHSKRSIAGAVAAGGIAGALLGTAVMLVPGIGPVAVAGVIATSALSQVAAVSAAIGSTGGAIARMLTDHDVDGVSASFYEQQIRRGKIFMAVDTEIAANQDDVIRRVFRECEGRTSVG